MHVVSTVELTPAEIIDLTGEGHTADDIKLLQGISIDLSGPARPAYTLTEDQIIILHDKGCPAGAILTCTSPERKHELFEKYVYTITDREKDFLTQRSVDPEQFRNRGIARAAIKLICTREKASVPQIQELNRMKQEYGLGADAHVPTDLTRAAAHALINGWRRLRPPTKDQLRELDRRGMDGQPMPTTFDEAHQILTSKQAQRKRKLGAFQMEADKARYIREAGRSRVSPLGGDDDLDNILDGTTTPPTDVGTEGPKTKAKKKK